VNSPGALDLAAIVGQLPRPRPHAARRQPLSDLLVDLLDLAEERSPPAGNTCVADQNAMCPPGRSARTPGG